MEAVKVERGQFRSIDVEPGALSMANGAAWVGLSRSAFYPLVMGGEIPSFVCGRRRLVPIAGLREWVERKTREAAS